MSPRVSRFVMPQEVSRVFRYAWQSNTATSSILSSTTGYFVFRGNNMFNPNATILGENYPVGIPAMANLYQFYYVRSATLKVTVSTTATIAVSNCRFIIWSTQYQNGLPLGAQTVDDFDGQPNSSRVAQVGPVSGTTVASISQSRRSAEMLSRTESSLHCSVEASGALVVSTPQPTIPWYFIVVYSNNDPTAIVLPDMLFHFELTFDAVLFAPVPLPISADIVYPRGQTFLSDPKQKDPRFEAPHIEDLDFESINLENQKNENQGSTLSQRSMQAKAVPFAGHCEESPHPHASRNEVVRSRLDHDRSTSARPNAGYLNRL